MNPYYRSLNQDYGRMIEEPVHLAVGTQKRNMIILVGDKSTIRRYLREMLVQQYDIVEAVQADEGFKLAQKLHPDLVIFDITLPGMDWTGLCKALRNDRSTGYIPLILVFSQWSEAIIVKGFDSGADDCIVRPFNVNIFKARIKSLVDKRNRLMGKIRRENVLPPSPSNVTHSESKFLEQLHGIIEENLSNPLFKVERLCDNLYMSRSSMYRKLRSLTGKSPQMFIRSYRLKRAAQLLEENYGNVTEVCFSVGFTSTAYFTKCFKKNFQLCPKIFARAKGIDRWNKQ